jgi:hypothetical protein
MSVRKKVIGKSFAECKIVFAECLRHSAKNESPVVSPRVIFFAECFSTLGKVFTECRKNVLDKEPFAHKIFVEYSYPSVTLRKGFAECKIAFAESRSVS